MSPRERLDTARLYLVCDARPLEWLRAALRGGVDLVQLRDRTLDDAGLVEAAVAFRTAASEAGALFILNDRPDLVEACDADGVHVGQDDATPARGARGVGPRPDRRPLDARAGAGGRRAGRPRRRLPRGRPGARDADQAGPPGGGARLRRRTRRDTVTKPWFAIGGLDAGNVGAVLDRGARADRRRARDRRRPTDPEAAARALGERLGATRA